MAKATTGTEPDATTPDSGSPPETPNPGEGTTPDPDAPAADPDPGEGDDTEDAADEGGVKMDDIAALTGAQVSTGAKPDKPEPFLSAGMADDIERVGYAYDPSSGAKFIKDPETGLPRLETEADRKADKGSGD
jgi:hypothetical protein